MSHNRSLFATAAQKRCIAASESLKNNSGSKISISDTIRSPEFELSRSTRPYINLGLSPPSPFLLFFVPFLVLFNICLLWIQFQLASNAFKPVSNSISVGWCSSIFPP